MENHIFEKEPRRKLLFSISFIVFTLMSIAGYTEYYYRWITDGIWIIIAIFGLFSFVGLFVSMFGKDSTVETLLGRI